MQDSFDRRHGSPLVALAYAGLIVLFVWTFSQFHLPGKGFTYLLSFGSELEDSRLSMVRKLDYFVEKASDGYDAQYYAQIAMDPSLQNRELRNAVDSLSYRARRILLPATAHVFGLGDPARIIEVFALQNAVAWLLLALLLLHWFPPRNWENFVRWAGVLGAFGLCVSVRNALTDGPSLLLIAFGVFLLEKGRPWAASAVLGISGLAKETNLLGAAAFLPVWSAGKRTWMIAVGRGLLVALPLALWLGYISLRVGPVTDTGVRNFSLPFAAYADRWVEIGDSMSDLSFASLGPLWSLLMIVALTVQFLFLVARPRWDQPWWRIGISFAVLMVFLGEAVWEGYPGAASRVLLPMQLAFNVLVPSGRRWMLVLLLGNITFLGSPSILRPPLSDSVVVSGPGELLTTTSGATFRLEMEQGWYQTELGVDTYWTWSAGDAVTNITNPHSFPVKARLSFALTTNLDRDVEVTLNGVEVWRTSLTTHQQVSTVISDLVLAPGSNRLKFTSNLPAALVGKDPRPLAFCVHAIRLRVGLALREPLP